MSRQTQSYDDKAIRGEELESLATSIAQKIVDNGQVVADALDELDARTRALENRNPDVLGDAVADSLDTQVLKIGGQPIDTRAFEQVSNKVSAWQTTPDNTHYPSEKLVKDGLDAKADANKVVAIADAQVVRSTATSNNWLKAISHTHTAANTNIVGVWKISFVEEAASHIAYEATLIVNIRCNGSGQQPTIYNAFLKTESSYSLYSVCVEAIGVAGNVVANVYFNVPSYGAITIKCLSNGARDLSLGKTFWTYTSYGASATGVAKPVTDEATNTKVQDALVSKVQYNIANSTNNNLVAMDANGLVKDSGLTKSSVESAISSAGSAIQGVKVNNTTLTPDANKVVTVPLATTSADGAMSAADKAKLNNAVTKKTGLAYRGTVGSTVFKIADLAFATNNTYSDQLVFDVLYSSHPSLVATSRLVLAFTVVQNDRAYVGKLRNTIISNRGFSPIPYKFHAYADFANGKLTLFAERVDGNYVSVEATCIAANFEGNNILDNVNVYSRVTAELPESAVVESTVYAASATESSGTAPVKVDARGALTPVPMDSTPTASSTNLMTSGDIKTALDGKVDNSDIAKMVQVETTGTAVGSSLQPVYVDTNGVAKAGMYSSWESLRGNDNWINALSVGWYRSSGNFPTTPGTTPQYIRFFGLEQQGVIDFWVSQFGPNNPMAMHFTVDFTSSGPGTIVIKERTGYDGNNIESLVVYKKSGTSVRGLIIKIVNSMGYNFQWRSTGNITSSNCEKLTDTEYTTFIASYNIMTSVTPPTRGGFASNARNRQRNHDILDTGDVKSTYIPSGTGSTDPLNGVALATKNDLHAIRLTSSNDLNSIANTFSDGTLQVYNWLDSSKPSNVPENSTATMVQYGIANTSTSKNCVQVVYPRNSGYYFSRLCSAGTWTSWKKCYYEATSTYSATGTQAVNGTAVASAISTKQDSLSFMDDTEAHSLWTNAKANAS